MAEEMRLLKYSCLAPSQIIMPVAIEILKVIGPLSLASSKDKETRMWQHTTKAKASHYMLPQVSVAVKGGRPISVRVLFTGWLVQ